MMLPDGRIISTAQSIPGYIRIPKSNLWYKDVSCIYREYIVIDKECCGLTAIGMCHKYVDFTSTEKCSKCK